MQKIIILISFLCLSMVLNGQQQRLKLVDGGGSDADWAFISGSTIQDPIYRGSTVSIAIDSSTHGLRVDSTFQFNPESGTSFDWQDGTDVTSINYKSLLFQAPGGLSGSENGFTLAANDASTIDRTILGTYSFAGRDTSSAGFYQGAFMQGIRDGNWAGSNKGTTIDIWTTNPTETFPRQNFTFQGDGRFELDRYFSYEDGAPDALIGYDNNNKDLEKTSISGTAGQGKLLGWAGDPITGNWEWKDSSAAVSASNGLSLDAGDVKLGGTLTDQSTTISGGNVSLNIDTDTTRIYTRTSGLFELGDLDNEVLGAKLLFAPNDFNLLGLGLSQSQFTTFASGFSFTDDFATFGPTALTLNDNSAGIQEKYVELSIFNNEVRAKLLHGNDISVPPYQLIAEGSTRSSSGSLQRFGPSLVLLRGNHSSDGSIDATLSGQTLGSIWFSGRRNSTGLSSITPTWLGATINGRATQNWSNGNTGAELELWVNPTSTDNSIKAATFQEDGDLQLNEYHSGSKFQAGLDTILALNGNGLVSSTLLPTYSASNGLTLTGTDVQLGRDPGWQYHYRWRWDGI